MAQIALLVPLCPPPFFSWKGGQSNNGPNDASELTYAVCIKSWS